MTKRCLPSNALGRFPTPRPANQILSKSQNLPVQRIASQSSSPESTPPRYRRSWMRTGSRWVCHGTKTSLTQRTQRFLMQRSQRIWMQRAQRAFASVARKTLRCSITTGWQNETEGRWRIDGAIMFIDNRVKVKNIYVMRHSKTGQYASSPLFTRVWRNFIGIQEEDVEKCGSVIYWLSTGWLREADHRTKQKNLPLPSPHL